MTISNGYTTLAEAKLRIGNMTDTDASRDTSLESVIEACSRVIDDYAGFHIYVDASDVVRYYRATDPYMCYVDNLVSVTTLKTDDGSRSYADTWAITDFDLEPDNAAANGDPYQWICVATNGGYLFPLWSRGVKVTGKFGWSTAIPKEAAEACLLMVEQLWLRKDKPFGVSGGAGAMLSADVQSIMYNDPHIQSLLARFKRHS
jgi:uncharacterized protein YbdZ (MbtH family)